MLDLDKHNIAARPQNIIPSTYEKDCISLLEKILSTLQNIETENRNDTHPTATKIIYEKKTKDETNPVYYFNSSAAVENHIQDLVRHLRLAGIKQITSTMILENLRAKTDKPIPPLY